MPTRLECVFHQRHSHASSMDDIDSSILDISTELINDHESPTQASLTMSPKSFVKDVVKCL